MNKIQCGGAFLLDFFFFFGWLLFCLFFVFLKQHTSEDLASDKKSVSFQPLTRKKIFLHRDLKVTCFYFAGKLEK